MTASAPHADRAWGKALALAFCCAAAAIWLLGFPTLRPAIAGMLVCSGALIAWRPVLLWALLPVALALLDLVPWSGRLYFDEFDAALGIWLAIGWWRSPQAKGSPPDVPLRLSAAVLALALTIGVAKNLLPWPGINAGSFTSLLSPFNGMRIVRGAVWAMLLLSLAARHQSAGLPLHAMLARGMVTALAGVVLFIVGERLAFSALLDFSDGYRVAGPFSAMNTGGAYVECFLASATPFLLTRLLVRPGIGRALSGGLLLVATAYAVAVTFSRAGIVVWMAGVFAAASLCLRPGHGRSLARAIGLAGVLLLLIVSVSWPVLSGSYGQSRVAALQGDLETRKSHWRELLALMPDDVWTWTTGVGMGRFPATNLIASPSDQRTATAALEDRRDERLVRLGGGRPLYVEQFVRPAPGQPATVNVRARSAGTETASLTVSLCEKWLVASGQCIHLSFEVPPSAGAWVHASQTIPGSALPATKSSLPRPMKLGFSLRGQVPLELSSIQLSQGAREALIENPQFDQGLDHWHFTSDQHLAWHAKSLPLAVFFDLGLAGLFGFGALALLALVRSGRSVWHGSSEAVPLFCALASFLAIGSVDTLIDAPRFLLLLLLLSGLAAQSRFLLPTRSGAISRPSAGIDRVRT